MVTNFPPNILSDPPTTSLLETILNVVKPFLHFSFPIFTIAAIAELWAENQRKCAELKAQHNKEIEKLNEILSINNQQQIGLADLARSLAEEEKEAQESIKNINKLIPGIRQILDIRCSQYNPYKTKFMREQEQDKILHSAEVQHRPGLEHIFHHDYKHCGETRYSNGQLWRVYLELWKVKVDMKKYKNVVEKLEEKLKKN